VQRGLEGGEAVAEVGRGAVEGCAGEVTYRGDCGAECPADFAVKDFEIEIEIEIVYNMTRQTGPAAISRATLLRHTCIISKLGPGLSDQVHFLSTHLSAMCADVPRELYNCKQPQ
jgi:hypothetical protein